LKGFCAATNGECITPLDCAIKSHCRHGDASGWRGCGFGDYVLCRDRKMKRLMAQGLGIDDLDIGKPCFTCPRKMADRSPREILLLSFKLSGMMQK
jgi:hypothetical protein